ncbi:hypothetical protein T4C_1954 [Trichinella pseudospiralis]|uniref:Transmembrane protein n=1 Tax=Trichinella pseudospiralis TaxID=6337 RepID=A0A0V1JRN1_TRIPS|nr:hypothetical protein T4C_1954 [Trichinella pseudospiralis]
MEKKFFFSFMVSLLLIFQVHSLFLFKLSSKTKFDKKLCKKYNLSNFNFPQQKLIVALVNILNILLNFHITLAKKRTNSFISEAQRELRNNFVDQLLKEYDKTMNF